MEPKGVVIEHLVLAMRAPWSEAVYVHMGLPLGVVPHLATVLKLSLGWYSTLRLSFRRCFSRPCGGLTRRTLIPPEFWLKLPLQSY